MKALAVATLVALLVPAHLAAAPAADAVPVTHGPLMPAMLLLAQDVPTGIRPGAWIVRPNGCTLAFIVHDAAGAPYALTAGHCLAEGQPVSLYGDGVVGTVVASRNDGLGEDFALVRVHADKAHLVDPTMIGWGGPVGVQDGTVRGDVLHYGWGTATWPTDDTRCRRGTASVMHEDERSFAFVAAALWGDSGSAVIDADGRALGILTHVSTDPTGGATVLGTRVTYALAELEAMTGLELSLADGEPVRDECDRSVLPS